MSNHRLDCKCPFCKNKRGETRGESHPLFGTHRSEDTKRKLSAAKRGKKQSREVVENRVRARTRSNLFLDTYWNRDWLYDKYVVKNMTYTQIAELCRAHPVTILEWVRRHNIPVRRRGELRKGIARPAHVIEKIKATKQLRGPTIAQIENCRKVGKLPNDISKHPDGCKCQSCRAVRGEYVLENNPNWRGGTSYLPYSPKFNMRLKEDIRKRDGYICKYPDCGTPENGQKHTVHHINYDKFDCRPVNLITLCRSHNSRVNANRVYWEDYFTEILESDQGK